MRHVLSTHAEVAHFWSNQKQESGSCCNIFFKDKTIYSYGHHFPIASHVFLSTILFTNRSYSISTSKHISIVRRSISHNKKIISVKNPEDCIDNVLLRDTILDNLKDLQEKIIEKIELSIKARSTKEEKISSAYYLFGNMVDYFTLRGNNLHKDDRKKYSDYLALMQLSFENKTTTEAVIQAKINAEIIQKKYAIAQKRKNTKNIRLWKRGENAWVSSPEIFLRIKNDKVQSSQGAEITIQEAKLLWHALKNNHAILGMKLSGYTVLSHTPDILTIGCHKLSMAEVNRIGETL